MLNKNIHEWTGPTGVHFKQIESSAGTYYQHDTPDQVADILDRALSSKQRIRIWYGHTDTGKSWHEEYDIIGRVGRSTGEIKIPLMIANSRSMGGPGILDNCIVAIADRPGHFIYKHPKLDLGEWETGKPQSDGYLSAAYCNGELTAQFKTSKGAANYIGFMIGQRFCK